MATNFLRNGEYEVARLGYLKALKLEHPQPWRCYYRLAYIAMFQNDKKSAEEYFQKAFRAEPSFRPDIGNGETLRVP
jgi:Tfp pilus assembly protein PilF